MIQEHVAMAYVTKDIKKQLQTNFNFLITSCFNNSWLFQSLVHNNLAKQGSFSFKKAHFCIELLSLHHQI